MLLLSLLAVVFLRVLAFSFLVYLIPFVGPSTMILSGAIAAMHEHSSPIVIASAVAVGASAAKAVMYYVSYFAGKKLSADRVAKLKGYGSSWGRWKAFAVLLASATPVPDEPVLVSLALVEYSPLSFFLWFFVGKMIICIPGAYLGQTAGVRISDLIGDVPTIAASALFTIIITLVLMKIDLGRLWSHVWRKLPSTNET